MTIYDAGFCALWIASIFAIAGLIMGVVSLFERVSDAITGFVNQFLAGCGGF
jgi:hypothetical protein